MLQALLKKALLCLVLCNFPTTSWSKRPAIIFRRKKKPKLYPLSWWFAACKWWFCPLLEIMTVFFVQQRTLVEKNRTYMDPQTLFLFSLFLVHWWWRSGSNFLPIILLLTKMLSCFLSQCKKAGNNTHHLLRQSHPHSTAFWLALRKEKKIFPPFLFFFPDMAKVMFQLTV